jgi:4-hydroxythreonine-4-phosphate dehydrogenase
MRARRLALTLGDRYGVGPELVARLSGMPQQTPGPEIVVVGDPAVWDAACDITRVPTTLEGRWSFAPRRADLPVSPMGHVAAAAGREVLDTLALLCGQVRAGEIDGIVYAPLNKQAMRLAGHAAGDELDFFNQGLRPTGRTGEINILGEVWTSRVTSHVPLRAVGDLITRENLLGGIELLAAALKSSGRAPRLAVAALNPHAGEGGTFGREEIDVLAPTIAQARADGLEIDGPFPSDTIFPRAVKGAFNGVVTMFHDQGQIALKMIGLGEGITLLAGFPVPIATPGHGTAYDIAGKGLARVDGLAAALRLVETMIGGRP